MKHVALLLALLVCLPHAVSIAQVPAPVARASQALRMTEPLRHARTADSYRPSEITHLYQQELNWINETRIRNEFVGNLLWQQHHDTWNGDVHGEWQEAVVIINGYADGMLSETTTHDIGETGMITRERTLYTYQDGVYREVTTQEFDGSAWVNVERTTYAVANGQITRGVSSTWNGIDWEPVEQFALLEDENGVTESYQEWSGATWVNTERSIYPGLTVAELYEAMERLMAELADYEGLYYSLRGFPDFVEQQWEDEAWVNMSRSVSDRTYHFSTGHLLQEVTTQEEWDGDAWVPYFQTVVDYSPTPEDDGLPTKTSVRAHTGEAWADVFVEYYVVQSDIRRIVQATVESDFGEGLQETHRILIEWTAVATDVDPTEPAGSFTLAQNVPNPVSSTTDIIFRLSEPQHVRLAVYDLLGRQIAVLANGSYGASEHRLRWDATDAPSGIYLYRLEAGARSETRRMLVVK